GWARVSTLPPAPLEMRCPEFASPNTTPPHCRIEKLRSGLFCTASNHLCRRRRCAHCVADNGLPPMVVARLRANRSEQGTAGRVKTSVEIAQKSNRQRSPHAAGVERSGRGDYLEVGPG